ncbi:pyridoxal 4-dehydrogenase (plasmid) [Deinococcus aetherius]|uniref:Pyridoxal 4-dehydrogenase n=1 Tax=Deinococcus aetherius TaxID=200252 RepID=A0ABN6RPA2_9DEIO|nr:aldo/keto reductase [Deinococcus aetherius]BDP44226.1 pyridoxal 4-dehydrogenase [Deinococcus aetherius]
MTDAFEHVRLRGGGVSLPRLGFGTAPLGGLYTEVPDGQARAVLDAAWNAGLRYFDTAPWYGYGLAEERLGEALRGREGYVLSSKVGRVLRADIPPHSSQFGPDGTPGFKTSSPLNVEYDYSYDGFLRSFEDSLRRLGVERLDILFIHDPDAVGVSVGEIMRGGYRALHELREQGLVGAIGAGMNQWEMPAEFLREGDFDVFLLAGRYTLLEQESLREFLPLCEERGAKVVIGGVYNSGLLAGPGPGAPYNYAPAPPEVLARAQAIEAVCSRHGIPLKAAALQFPLAHPAVASVLVAGRVPEHLEENLRLLRAPIPPELWEDLKAGGLLAPDAPTPGAPG